MIKLDAKQLRNLPSDQSEAKKVKKNPIYIILDNVLDTYNIGSVFRLAEALAVTKVYLCGATETPPNTRIKKASINTTEWVEWEYAADAASLISILKFKISNLKVYAVEQDEKSVPYTSVDYQFPCAIVVGNETYGIQKKVLENVDQIVEIPMFGVNKSLNVMVSLAIVAFKVMENFEVKPIY